MAKIIGQIEQKEIKARIKQARKIRYHKPLKTQLGPILVAALKEEAKIGR